MTALIAFLIANKVVLASFGVALVDLLIALNPNLSSNGILHAIYLQAQKLKLPGA